MIGASGAGKSSLVRAGLVLGLPWFRSDVRRVAVLQPDEFRDDPFEALARALLMRAEDVPDAEQGSPAALPELGNLSLDVTELARLLAHEADTAVYLILATLAKIGDPKLLLIVDPLDKFFDERADARHPFANSPDGPRPKRSSLDRRYITGRPSFPSRQRTATRAAEKGWFIVLLDAADFRGDGRDCARSGGGGKHCLRKRARQAAAAGWQSASASTLGVHARLSIQGSGNRRPRISAYACGLSRVRRRQKRGRHASRDCARAAERDRT